MTLFHGLLVLLVYVVYAGRQILKLFDYVDYIF